MQLLRIPSIAAAAALALMLSHAAASAPSGGAAAGPPARDLTAEEAARAIGHIYEGKTQAALAVLDSVSAECGGEPFYLFVLARVRSELLPMDDHDKDRFRLESEPVHRDLERVIAICTERMETGDSDPKLLLYRGLAWMSKAQLGSFARNFWRAARDAKKGKSDLEAYLLTHPDDALARGTLGIVLYFADNIPGLFKIVGRLLFLPAGDREAGLRYLEEASSSEGLLRRDFEVILNTVEFLFEGRHEDGIAGTLALRERSPGYIRLAVPIALFQPFDPFGAARDAAAVDSALARRQETGDDNDEGTRSLLSFLRAWAGRFSAPPDTTIARLESIVAARPARPDWITGYANFELGRVLASQDRFDAARERFEAVLAEETAAYLRGEAEEMLEALSSRGSNTDGKGAGALFHLGEARLLSHDGDGAVSAYEAAVELDAPPWDEEFQMFASSRIAEILGARGEYREAASWTAKARAFYHAEFLVDWVFEGRKRFFERLADGEETPPPALFLPRADRAGPANE